MLPPNSRIGTSQSRQMFDAEKPAMLMNGVKTMWGTVKTLNVNGARAASFQARRDADAPVTAAIERRVAVVAFMIRRWSNADSSRRNTTGHSIRIEAPVITRSRVGGLT